MTRRLALLLLAGLAATAAERLDPTLVVVAGGGISAGFANFRLTEVAQNQAWPIVAARQMGTYIAVPAMRESGQVGVVNAYQPLAGLLPRVAQSGERALPFPFFSLNLSVPFLRLSDALRTRPKVQWDGIKLITAIEGDIQTTLINAIIGGPFLTLQPPVLLTQAEYAAALNPTLVFVQLGFEDVVEAAVRNDASRITSTASFSADYAEMLTRLRTTDATLVVMTVPDPTECAYFATQDELARQYGVTVEELRTRFGLAAGDLLTLGGMVETANAIRGRRGNTLPPGSVLSASVAAAVRSAVSSYNSAIRAAAQGRNAGVFDLAEYFRQVKAAGARAGNVTVTAAYGGGFYSEDGLYPSETGQALLGNAVLQFLNTKHGTNFRPAAVPAP
jgi:hypothetical protein